MATSATSSAALRTAFGGLIDYAGLFPPARLEMDAALAEYAAARRGANAWMLARFIVPESRLEELLQLAPDPLALSVIVDAPSDSRTWFAAVTDALARIARRKASGIAIESVELAVPQLRSQRETYDAPIGQFSAAAARAGMDGLPSYIELPQDDRRAALLHGALAAMKRHRLGAKIRCGGVTAQSVPAVYDVATFLRAAGEEDVAFKATAGLHHAIRGYNEQSGFMMHGFLNLLTAAALVESGAGEDDVIGALEDEDAGNFGFDAQGLRWRGTVFGEDALRGTRAKRFNSYGSCSFSEPVEELAALGLLP